MPRSNEELFEIVDEAQEVVKSITMEDLANFEENPSNRSVLIIFALHCLFTKSNSSSYYKLCDRSNYDTMWDIGIHTL